MNVDFKILRNYHQFEKNNRYEDIFSYLRYIIYNIDEMILTDDKYIKQHHIDFIKANTRRELIEKISQIPEVFAK